MFRHLFACMFTIIQTEFSIRILGRILYTSYPCPYFPFYRLYKIGFIAFPWLCMLNEFYARKCCVKKAHYMNIAYNYIIFYLRSETENMTRPADKFLENFINIHNVSQCTFNDVNMLYSMYLQSLISSKVLF